jgi:hypothetical protein
MEYDIFDPYVFRKCLGWKDTSGDYKLSKGHEDYFLIHPSEHLMPDIVPRKARCKSCEAEFKRYQTLIRVRRYRISRKQTEVLKNYIEVYQASLIGKITLPPKILINLRKIIIENGGILEEKKKEATE